MQYSSNLGVNSVELCNGQNQDTIGDRQTQLKELSYFLRRLSHAMIYLELINSGINQRNFSGKSKSLSEGFFDNSSLNAEEVVIALFEAFFFCFNLSGDDATCWDFAEVQQLLTIAAKEINQLSESKI